MGTRGRVPKINVTSTNIRYVADIDYSLGQGMVTSDQLFQDNDVRGEYIDPVYCEGETDNDRLTIFQDKPLHSGEWRNYGGEETITEGIPEIYFKNILGKGYNDGNNIEFIPELPEDLQFLVDNDLILGTAVPPNLDIVDDYASQSVIDSKVLVDATQAAMFRDGNDNVLNISDLGIRVGLDYPNGPSTEDARFSYNISISYGDIPRELVVIDPVEPSSGKKKTLLNISYIIGASGTLGYIGARVNHAKFWNIPGGPLKAAWTKFKAGWNVIDKFATTSPLGTALVPIFAALASYTAMIMVADMIWKMVTNATKVVDGIYQYKNLVDGMYTWDDIKKSKYQIGLGSLYTGTDKFISKLISKTKDQNIHTAEMNSVVYPQTIIPEGDSPIFGRRQYANFKFFPKCNQYDLMTPPPIITYTIQLEAISGCRLSTTKPTVFTISIAPDKYLAPVFDVITPRGRSSVSPQDVYINDAITFQNSKYVDFLALLDLDKSSSFLGLFPTYENRYINTDGDDLTQFNMHLPVTEDDIVTTGGTAFGGVTYPAGGALQLYPAQSTYDVAFMQEAQGNIIKNSTFRLEQLSSDPDDETYLLRKYWNYDASWEIRDGAIYRDTTSNLLDGIWQQVPLFVEVHSSRGKYYFIDIDCTVDQSYLAIELAGTFRYGLCNWLSSDSYYNHSKYERKFLLAGDYPPNVTLVGTQLRISATGKYRLLLRVSNPSNNILKIIPDYSYTGRINYLSLQYMPTQPVGSVDSTTTIAGVVVASSTARGAVNALVKYNQPRLKVRWMDAVLQAKRITLNVTIGSAPTFYIKFTPLQSEYQHYTITIDWGDGGSPTVYENLVYQEYVEFKNYFWPGNKTITITCTIPGTGYNLQNLFETFSCNETELVKYKDNDGLLYGGDLDLSGSNVGLYRYSLSSNYMNTESFLTPLSSLDVSSTPMSGNCDKLHIVTDYLDISDTQITGDLTSLFDIAYVDASNTLITLCSGSAIPTGEDGNKTIIWKNTGMSVDQLYNLVRAIDLSNIEEGYLDIKGINPAITDQVTLDRITMLTTILGEPDGLGGIGRGWTILYNSVDATFENTLATLIYNTELDQYELTIGYELFINQYDPTSVLYFDIYDIDDNFLETVSRAFTEVSPNVWTIPVDSLEDVYIFSPTLYTLTVNNGTIAT